MILLSGKTKMLYVAPETLTKQENIDFFKDLKFLFLRLMKHIVFRNGDMISGRNTAG